MSKLVDEWVSVPMQIFNEESFRAHASHKLIVIGLITT